MRSPALVLARSLALIALVVSPLPAQPGERQQTPPQPHLDKAAVVATLWRFEADHGDGWLVRWRQDTGHVRLLFGSHTLAPAAPPGTDAEFEALARTMLQEYAVLFGVRDQDLELAGVNHSPLETIGTSNKVGVQFRQVVGGIDVYRGWVSVIFLESGEVVAIHAEVLPDAPFVGMLPRLPEEEARQLALADLAARLHVSAQEARAVEPVIYPATRGNVVIARLSWRVTLQALSLERPEIPIGEHLFVDAETGEILGRESLVHEVDLIGTLEGWGTPGTLPDASYNPEVILPIARDDVTATGLGTAVTDLEGDFIFPNVNPGTYTVSASLYGTWCDVNTESGSDLSVSDSVTAGVPKTLTFNTSKTETGTAQVNAYYWVIALREWMLSVDPTFDPMNFRVRAQVNKNNTCNAYYDGSSINFFLAGSGCVNTAYSTVVMHEEGHWANDLTGSGNGSDGFGEGASDVWAMYPSDQPVVGEDFFGSGTYIRTGLNTRQFCGDDNPGCYGGVHADGEVLMGALWKVRARLNTSLGDAAGDAVADALYIAWFDQYDDGQIKSWVRDHWLVLDDDDGNVNNGTPHFADIEGGFTDQGWPPFEIQPISITHTPLPDTQNESGPYTAIAEVISNMGNSITSVQLRYDVGSGYTTVTMTPTGNPDEYSGDIPGQPSPKVVRYYIWAQDSAGNTTTDPLGAPGQGTHAFSIGVRGAPFYFDNFETNTGWTHSGTGQDDWQRGTPQGKAGDPSSAYSGTNVWGNDLGGSGWNGEYQNNVNNNLTSPSINCSGRVGVHLELKRWLTVEKGIYDQARIEVSVAGGSYTTVWQNADGTDHIDTSWQAHEVDISSLADNQSNVKLRFHLITDGGLTFGGWNIDDVGLTALEPSGDTTPPVGPTNLSSPTHQVNVWSNNPSVQVQWTPATDSGSGLDGYSVLWDQSPSTTPDTVKDIEEGATSYLATLSSSNQGWYFHIAAVDNAGNWGSPAHFGPVLIDTTAPNPPVDLTSPTHSPGQWSTNTTVTVTWTAAVDPIGAGLDGYSILWDQSASTNPDTSKDIEESVTENTTTLASSAQGWYFHIRPVDQVGNWGSAVHFGPILLDDVAPTGSIVIEDGAAATLDLLVTLDLGAVDLESGMGSGATMKFSNDGVTWSPEEPYAPTRDDWDLSSYGGTSDPGTKTVYVVFRDVAGNASTAASDTIEYAPLPEVTGIDPGWGPFAGGTEVTITGSGFTPDSAVTFGLFPAASVSYVSSTELLVTTPPAYPLMRFLSLISSFFLPVDVEVATAYGTDTVENGFLYVR
ncbi:MAG: IPT/TIG domain-containing protein [Planctomycetota bacterium]